MAKEAKVAGMAADVVLAAARDGSGCGFGGCGRGLEGPGDDGSRGRNLEGDDGPTVGLRGETADGSGGGAVGADEQV